MRVDIGISLGQPGYELEGKSVKRMKYIHNSSYYFQDPVLEPAVGPPKGTQTLPSQPQPQPIPTPTLPILHHPNPIPTPPPYPTAHPAILRSAPMGGVRQSNPSQ